MGITVLGMAMGAGAICPLSVNSQVAQVKGKVWMFPRPILAPHSSLGSFQQGRMEATHRVLGEQEVLSL